MKVAPEFVRQAMVKEIDESGQALLEASTLMLDARARESACLYARAGGIRVEHSGTAARVDDFECGYTFAYEAPREVAVGALQVLAHMRVVLGR